MASFGSFAYKSEENGQAKDSAPPPAKRSRIITSDDEDEDDTPNIISGSAAASSLVSPGGSDWLQSRNAHPNGVATVNSGDLLAGERPQGGLETLEDTPEAPPLRLKLKLTRTALEQPAEPERLPVVPEKKKAPKKQMESEDESSDDDGYNDGDDEQDVVALAKKVLKNCEAFSANLRRSLREWGQNGQSESGDGGNDCINLTSIKTSKSAVLSDEDIADICPDLTLKPYQLVGVNWLKLLYQNKINGVLADDMGLGKTVQTISFLGWLKTQVPVDQLQKPHLVVVPASVLANWQNEFARFCPSFRLRTYHGSQNERMHMRYELKGDIQRGEVDVILTTYTLFERDSGKDDRKFLYNLHIDFLVLDEAHCIKNATSSRYVHLAHLRSRHRLLLSGTPVQNDLGELLALLSFLMPKTFSRSDCELLIEAFGWSKSAGNAASGSKGFSLAQVRGMLAPFVLRRVKIDVLDQLVAKTTILEKVAMTPSQQNVYQGILMSYAKRREDLKRKAASQLEADRMLDAKKKKTPSAAANGATENETKTEEGAIDLTSSPSTDTTRTSIESATAAGEKGSDDAEDPVVRELSSSEMKHLFTALRKAANHPLLLRVKYQDEVVMNKIAEVSHAMEHFGNQCDLRRVREELDKFSDYDLHQLCMEYPAYLSEYIVPAEMLYNSPKLMRLKSLLPELISQGHRILVFSQWTRLLDLLEVFMNDNGFKFLRLDGSTPIKERQIRIDKFNGKGVPEEDLIPVFLLSTKAGGLGINLTAADTVVLHDLDFNPENDKQAEDRCHRIGQTKPVTVYKLVTEDTVDEDIYDIGERKSKLSSAVLSDYSKQTQEESAGVGGKKKSSAKNDDGGEVSEGDIGMIGRILQKALMKASSK